MKVSDLKGKFLCTATLDGEHVLENKQSIIDNITKQCVEQGIQCTLNPEGTMLLIGTNQNYRLPLLPRERSGSITFRSADYIFEWEGKQSHGDKPKAAAMLDDGFTLTMFNGQTITYKLGKQI